MFRLRQKQKIDDISLKEIPRGPSAYAFDFDGVLFDIENGRLYEGVLEGIANLLKKKPTAIITGRTGGSILELLVDKLKNFVTEEELKNLYIYSEHGARILNGRGEVLRVSEFAHKDRVYELMKDSIPDARIEKRTSIVAVYERDPKKLRSYRKMVGDMIKENEIPCVIEMTNVSIDVLPEGVSKENSLVDFCNRVGVKTEDSAAFGDALSDRYFLRLAGVGVFVGKRGRFDPRIGLSTRRFLFGSGWPLVEREIERLES